MPNYRLPGGLAQITVNGRTYRADAAGLVTATGVDAAAIAGAGGLVDGGAGSAPEWSLAADGTADGLIGPDGTKATGNTAIAAAALAGSDGGALSADRTLTAADNGKSFYATTALTVTVPLSLSPRPSVIIDCPPTGNLSIASSGGTLINGATTTLTRTRATNPVGVAIQAHQDADSYGVSGA